MSLPAATAAAVHEPAAHRATVLALHGVGKAFGGTVALDDVTLEVPAGEILALVGPSGCGKSTLLRVAAGLLRGDRGSVRIRDTLVDGPAAWVPAESRNVGMVFQDLALFPHLSVAGNVGFGLVERSRRRLEGSGRFAGSAQRRARVAELLDLVGLGHLADRYPHELSGGEQQRVALARALAPAPAVVLLDEPFSGLDRNLRDRLRAQTVDALRRAGATAVLVTHDREEAMAAGDRLAVMRAGRIEHLDDPSTVFHAPRNRFVATFMGEADFLPAERDRGRLVTEAGDAPGPDAPGPDAPGPDAAGGHGPIEIMVRPHEAMFVEDGDGNATVVRAELAGAHVRYELLLDSGRRLRSLQPHTVRCAPGTRVRLWIEHGHPPATFARNGALPGPQDDAASGPQDGAASGPQGGATVAAPPAARARRRLLGR